MRLSALALSAGGATLFSLFSCIVPVYGSVIPLARGESSEASEVSVEFDGEPAQNLTLRDIPSGPLEKRFSNARFTFYDAGLGACGRVNKNSDFVSDFTLLLRFPEKRLLNDRLLPSVLHIFHGFSITFIRFLP